MSGTSSATAARRCAGRSSGATTGAGGTDDTPTLAPGARPISPSEKSEEALLEGNAAYTARRTAGDRRLAPEQAGALRAAAARAARRLAKAGTTTAGTAMFAAPWA